MKNIIVFIFFLLLFLATAKAQTKKTCMQRFIKTLKTKVIHDLGEPKFTVQGDDPFYYYDYDKKLLSYSRITVLDVDAFEEFLSHTDYRLRGYGLHKKIIEKIFEDFGTVNYVSASLHENNQFVFIKALMKILRPNRELPDLDYFNSDQLKELFKIFIENYQHQYTILPQDELSFIHEQALKETPFYKTMAPFGLSHISHSRIHYYPEHQSFGITIVVSRKDL